MRCRCLTGLRMPSSISREKMAAMSFAFAEETLRRDYGREWL